MNSLIYHYTFSYIVFLIISFGVMSWILKSKLKNLGNLYLFIGLLTACLLHHFIFGDFNERVFLINEIRNLEVDDVLDIRVHKNEEFIKLNRNDFIDFVNTIKYSDDYFDRSISLKERLFVFLYLKDSKKIILRISNTNNTGVIIDAIYNGETICNFRNDDLASRQYLFTK